MKLLFAILFALSFSASAQVDGIAIGASRTVTLAADETDMSIGVLVDTGTPQDQVLTALQPLGITAQNLTAVNSTAVYNYSGTQPTTTTRLVYMFTLAVPYAKTKDTVDKLETARKAFQANGQDLQYALFVSASASAVDDARQQIVPDLIAQAKKRAEFLANASQVKLGAIASISDYSSSPVNISSPSFFNSAVFTSTSGSSGEATGIRVTFSVNVRFKII